MRTFFLAPTHYGDGLTSSSLGLVHALQKQGLRVGFFKPISQQDNPVSEMQDFSEKLIDQSSLFMKTATGLEAPESVDLNYVQRLLNASKRAELMDEIVERFQTISNVDAVVVEGLVPTRDSPYLDQLNAAIARALDASVLIVAAQGDDDAFTFEERIEKAALMFGGIQSDNVLGVIINKVGKQHDYSMVNTMDTDDQYHVLTAEQCFEKVKNDYLLFKNDTVYLAGAIPWTPSLLAPTVMQVAEYLKAEWINGHDTSDRRIHSISMCSARTIPNVTPILRAGELLAISGDQDALLLAACMAALNGVPLAGILLMGGAEPDSRVMDLCQEALATGLPIISVPISLYGMTAAFTNMNVDISADDKTRIEHVMGTFSSHIDSEWLRDHAGIKHESRMSPPAFRHELIKRAVSVKKRIILPEGNEPRTVQAAIICHQKGIAQCVLLAEPESIARVAKANGITLPDDIEIIDPSTVIQQYIAPMVALRQHKGLTVQMAEAQLSDTVVLATMMLALNEVDGMVSGAAHTMTHTVRPAFQLIKAHQNIEIVSSVIFILLKNRVLVYGDCAINPDPTAEELALIAIQSAASALSFGIVPRVSMISDSTETSGVTSGKVHDAIAIIKQRAPHLDVDGPLRYEDTGESSVCIFPNFSTGNNIYTAVKNDASITTIGPMLQGLNKPVNDLPRDALVDDIVYMIALTAIQAK